MFRVTMWMPSLGAALAIAALVAGGTGCDKAATTDQPAAEAQSVEAATTPSANAQEIVIDIEGMVCTGCESTVSEKLSKMGGVESVRASHADGKAWIVCDPAKVKPETLVKEVTDLGYTASLAAAVIDSPEATGAQEPAK